MLTFVNKMNKARLKIEYCRTPIIPGSANDVNIYTEKEPIATYSQGHMINFALEQLLKFFKGMVSFFSENYILIDLVFAVRSTVASSAIL